MNENLSQCDRYLSLEELSTYSGLSKSTIKSKIRKSDRNPNPIPSHNPTGGKIFVKVSEYDEWVKRSTSRSIPEGKINGTDTGPKNQAIEALKRAGIILHCN